MIPELGHFALILALTVALVQGTLPLVGASRGDARLMALGSTAALTQVTEGTTTPVGTTVASLISSGWITDADIGTAPKAIAVSSADSTGSISATLLT